MNISKDEVEEYLTDIREAVNAGRYRVSSRRKNEELNMKYIFTEID